MRQIYDTDIGLDEYKISALKTVTYPNYKDNPLYPTLGLCGEVGEIAEKIKKLWRDKGMANGKLYPLSDTQELAKELGDVLWYIAALSEELGLSLAGIAIMNLEKLKSRQDRNKLKGSGDNR